LIAVKRQNEEREAAERAAAQARIEEKSRKTAEAEAERADAERARQEADAARAGALDQQHVPKQRLKELSWRPSKPIETDKMPKTRMAITFDRAIECDSGNARHRPWTHREYVGALTEFLFKVLCSRVF
jgi:hypothetical protein